MKFAVKLVLIIFVTFLSTPTIVSLIEKNSDTSYFYSVSEEEQSNKEIKAEFNFDTSFEFIVFSNPVSKPILSKNLLKHDAISSKIFIPPPEQV